jgi:hypothetical protein
MELRHLRYFVAVGEALNFTKAAARLRVAQPALSRQVSDLEDELGVDLLNRTSHVYVAAFAPDRGESVASLIANPPLGAPVPPILPPKDGYLFLDRNKFAASFAADVEPETASFMADSQVPWGLDALQGAVSGPAWKTKASHYLVASDDKMIPPPAQRAMAGRAKAQVMEVPGSHAVYVSKPAAVAEIIEKAANLCALSGKSAHHSSTAKTPPLITGEALSCLRR